MATGARAYSIIALCLAVSVSIFFMSTPAGADIRGRCVNGGAAGVPCASAPSPAPSSTFAPAPVYVPSPNEIAHRRSVELNNKGTDAYERGDYQEAIRLYQLSLKAAPPTKNTRTTRVGLGKAYHMLGIAAFERKDYTEALRLFVLANSNNPGEKATIKYLEVTRDTFDADLRMRTGVHDMDAAKRRFEALTKITIGPTSGLPLDFMEAGPSPSGPAPAASTVTAVTPSQATVPTADARIIKSMNAEAKRLGWSAAAQTRLAQALNSLDLLDADLVPATGSKIKSAWNDILGRGNDRDLAHIASAGKGPGFPGAGTQSFNDCAIFALANAAGVPYGVVAARAAELISKGEWRDAAARANPQKAIEKRGLTGGEVVMMAEILGQAEVVRPKNFASTLSEGRRLMVNVVPNDGDIDSGHQVVLTKAFQHRGETWFEMMDSNQGPMRRLYLSAKELNLMIKENGVAFRPEPGTTAKLLR